MIMVVVALLPATLFGMWNVGYQFQRATIDWQGTFEASSSDKVGFATFVHCLLDGAAEFSWLHVSPDAPPPPATGRQMTPTSARAR